jgi:hypothetical protein
MVNLPDVSEINKKIKGSTSGEIFNTVRQLGVSHNQINGKDLVLIQ